MILTQPTKARDIKRSWLLFDAKGKILGRLATQIAQKLIGKGKPYFVSYLDCGDYVVVLNSMYVKVTGKKETQKVYEHYSGYPGGRKVKTLAQVRVEQPVRIIREAVSGMLPKNKLRASMMRRLFIFSDDNHPYKDKINSKSEKVPRKVNVPQESKREKKAHDTQKLP